MGLGSLGKIVSVANPAMALAAATTGNFADRQEQRHNAKQQYVYNSWLQSQNENFQKYMATNAHQMEVDDLKKAGLNPILSAMGSSAGSIASSSAAQGTSAGNAPSNFSQGLQNALATIQTNSTKDLNEKLGQKAEAEALESAERTKNITPEAKAKIKNLNSATMVNEAEKKLKESETTLNNEGWGGRILGAGNGDLAKTLFGIGASMLSGAGAVYRGYKLYKGAKTAKGFANFIKSVT